MKITSRKQILLILNNWGTIVNCCKHMAHFKCLEECRKDQIYTRKYREFFEMSDSEFKWLEWNEQSDTVMISFNEVRKLIWRSFYINKDEHNLIKYDSYKLNKDNMREACYEFLNILYRKSEIEEKKETLNLSELNEDFETIYNIIIPIAVHTIRLADYKSIGWIYESGKAASLIGILTLLIKFTHKIDYRIDLKEYLDKTLLDENSNKKVIK